MTTAPRHAPVPAADCGNPLARPDLLPDDTAHYGGQLAITVAHGRGATALLDYWFGPLGLPTGRLVLRSGLHWFTTDGGTRTWLAVDYLVPGARRPNGTGWDVELNREAGRAQPDEPGANEPALDRWVVEVDALPDWLDVVRSYTGDPLVQEATHGA